MYVHMNQIIQEWTRYNRLKAAFKKLKWYDQLKADHTPSRFKRLFSTNLTWSILEYFVPYLPKNMCNFKMIVTQIQVHKNLS